jgi:hypothetical protein
MPARNRWLAIGPLLLGLNVWELSSGSWVADTYQGLREGLRCQHHHRGDFSIWWTRWFSLRLPRPDSESPEEYGTRCGRPRTRRSTQGQSVRPSFWPLIGPSSRILSSWPGQLLSSYSCSSRDDFGRPQAICSTEGGNRLQWSGVGHNDWKSVPVHQTHHRIAPTSPSRT